MSQAKILKKFNLLRQIKKYEKEQKSDFKLLFKKEIEEQKEKDNFYFQHVETKNEEEKETIKVSKKYSTLSNEMYKKMKLISKKTQNLKKLNTFSLQKISKEYFRLTPSKTLNLKNLKKIMNNTNIKNISNNNANTINTNSTQSSINVHNKNRFRTISAHKKISKSIFHNYNKTKSKENNIRKTLDLCENNKEVYDENTMSVNTKNMQILKALTKNKTSEKLKNYINVDVNYLYKHNNKNLINLDRFNNSFRVQMNNTCYKFIPRNHLKKLNEYQRDNMMVRKSMENIKGKLESEIQDFKDKKLLIKKYDKIKTKLRNEKNRRILSARKLTTYPDKIPNNIQFKSGQYFYPFGFKTRALYEHQVHSLESERHRQRLIKIEKRNEPQNNIKKNENLMEKALKKLNNSLSVKSIHKYIKDIKKQKRENRKMTYLSECKDKYFPELKEVNNYIQKFDIYKMNKKYKIKEKSKGFMELDEDDVELEENIYDVENELKKLGFN